MTTNTSDGKKSTDLDPIDALEFDDKTGKRATHEAFNFTPGEGVVEVANESHADADEHTYTVHLRRGVPSSCSCPADEYHEGACKHRVGVALAQPVIDAATVAPDEPAPRAMTDGGSEVIEAGDDGVILGDDSDGRPEDCSCVDWSTDLGLPCWPCYRDGFETVNPATPAEGDVLEGDHA
jgi:hypothetical protein